LHRAPGGKIFKEYAKQYAYKKGSGTMKTLMNAMFASLFVLAVLVSVPAYTDFVGNPVFVESQGAVTPDIMGSIGY